MLHYFRHYATPPLFFTPLPSLLIAAFHVIYYATR